MLLIVITIAALIVIINISWKTVPQKCWDNLNGSKEDILSVLKVCANNCWSKHDFGRDNIIDDCYTINIFSLDKNIEKKDIENLDKNFKSYLDPVLLKKTQYLIKVRYNYTGSEISFVNVGVCGNKILENLEECEGSDISTCTNSILFGDCTLSESKSCKNCKCYAELDCENIKCKNGMPTLINPDTNTDWCKFCKDSSEKECSDGIDNDCDGKIDSKAINPLNYDDDCPVCAGDAYLHADLWPFWWNLRTTCDYEHKMYWLCELTKKDTGFDCLKEKNDYLNCNVCIGKNGYCIPRTRPGSSICCSNEDKRCCNYNGPSPPDESTLFYNDHRSCRTDCNTHEYNYDILWGHFYGKEWKDDLGIISIEFYDKNDNKLIINGFSGVDTKINLDSSDNLGYFACYKIPSGDIIKVKAIINPTWHGECEYQKCVREISFVPKKGTHYLWNASGIYELNIPDCIGPPDKIKTKFPSVTCSNFI